MLLSAELLISLILSRSTHIDHVLRRVCDNVVGSPVFLNRGYLARLKLVELLLLRGVLGVIVLKPAATSMLAVSCVLVVVVAHPAINASNIVAPIIMTDSFLFHILGSFHYFSVMLLLPLRA